MKPVKNQIAFPESVFRNLEMAMDHDSSKSIIIHFDNGLRADTTLTLIDFNERSELFTFAGTCIPMGRISGQCGPEGGWVKTFSSNQKAQG